jgi:hypothetical protein
MREKPALSPAKPALYSLKQSRHQKQRQVFWKNNKANFRKNTNVHLGHPKIIKKLTILFKNVLLI